MVYDPKLADSIADASSAHPSHRWPLDCGWAQNNGQFHPHNQWVKGESRQLSLPKFFFISSTSLATVGPPWPMLVAEMLELETIELIRWCQLPKCQSPRRLCRLERLIYLPSPSAPIPRRYTDPTTPRHPPVHCHSPSGEIEEIWWWSPLPFT